MNAKKRAVTEGKLRNKEEELETLDITKDNVYFLFRQYAQSLMSYNYVSGESAYTIAGQLTLAHVVDNFINNLGKEDDE
jgi:hypothetical protein|tara:strand:- start:2169 stop:2405 length:237 start_codon:yes stop_codon:yes gene_type:complete